MKQLILLVLAFSCFSTFGQSKAKRISAQTTNFYHKVDTNWVETDTVGYFYREIEVAEDNSTVKLTMSSGVTVDNHIFYVDWTKEADGTTYYSCRNEANFPILFELNGDEVGLYYFYDEKAREYQKAEKLVVKFSK